MRYWHPFTESAVADIKADEVDEVVVLPLYPHCSISTSGSSFRELQRLRQADPVFAALPIRCIRSYHDDRGYIDAMAGLIAREIQACPARTLTAPTCSSAPTVFLRATWEKRAIPTKGRSKPAPG